MKKRTALFAGAALLALAGCGGGSGSSTLTGNYAFQGLLSQGGGTFFGGALTGKGGVTGTLHAIDSSNCISEASDIPVTGGVSGGKMSLNTATVEAQTFQLTGTVSSDGSTITNGQYKVTGGCNAGNVGTLTGFRVSDFTGTYNGTLTAADIVGNPTQTQYSVTANLTQNDAANSDGYYTATGPFTFGGSCFSGFSIASAQIFGTQFLLTLTPGGAAPTTGSPVLSLNAYATDGTATKISGSYTASNISAACNGNGFVALSR